MLSIFYFILHTSYLIFHTSYFQLHISYFHTYPVPYPLSVVFIKKIIFLSLLLSVTSLFAQKKAIIPENDPEWARKAVWYQIFPERFRNGDSKNDPVLADIKGAYPNDLAAPYQTHPWTSDWYLLQPYEKKNGKGIWHNIQRRRYGGDLQGILDKLDYLQDLGVNALYLNPLFTAPSAHKYDAACFHHIDPNFGPDPVGDQLSMLTEDSSNPETWVWTKADKLALKLIKECHKRGMHLIFDGVFNHTGVNFFAFKDIQRNGETSKYKDWYTINSFENKEKGTKLDYKAWFGVKELPELRKENGTLAKAPKQYIFESTKRWLDPDKNGNTSDGIDGWRLDVAFCVPHQFWKEWHKVVRDINPNAYTTAEVVQSPEQERDYVQPDEFAATMNYNFTMTAFEYFIQDKMRVKTSEFDYQLTRLRNIMGEKATPLMQNLYDSHDTNRFVSAILNRDHETMRDWGKYFGWSQADKNTNYDIRKPFPNDRTIQRLMLVFQMTYIGAPMIYYGDEVGMWGANDPDCRKPMVWADLKYEDEKTLPSQAAKRPDAVSTDQNLYDFYKKLIAIRNTQPALTLGDYNTILVNDEHQVFGFARKYNNQTVYTVLNNSAKAQSAKLTLQKNKTYIDLITNETYTTTSDVRSFNIPAKNALILIEQK
jgi:cyclomaltodextrinase / maltogenic alpha-amylase / neopullulanase